jgi:hypothetical protein
VVPYLVVAMQVTVHQHGQARPGEHGIGPIAPAHNDPALSWPGPRPESLAQGCCRGWRQLRVGELAGDGLGALARRRVPPDGPSREPGTAAASGAASAPPRPATSAGRTPPRSCASAAIPAPRTAPGRIRKSPTASPACLHTWPVPATWASTPGSTGPSKTASITCGQDIQRRPAAGPHREPAERLRRHPQPGHRRMPPRRIRQHRPRPLLLRPRRPAHPLPVRIHLNRHHEHAITTPAQDALTCASSLRRSTSRRGRPEPHQPAHPRTWQMPLLTDEPQEPVRPCQALLA